MSDIRVLRRFYARLITAIAGVGEPRLVEAFASVERERFLGPGPWQIKAAGGGYLPSETDDPAILYQDIVVGLLPERGLNNGEPSLHALCIGAAVPKPGEVVVHVGAGTGYYTAILAHLVAPGGHVDAFEIDVDLAARARANLADVDAVTIHARSAVEAPLPRADVIYVSAGATHVPAIWLDALAAGGRLVLPLTPTDRLGCMLLVTRLPGGDAFGARILSTASFIPCIGARDEAQSQALAEALDTRATDEVRSLRRGSAPDETVWCRGDGWWLSTREP